MPLTALIRYFNAADSAGRSTLYPVGKRVEAWHDGLRLGSLFQPITDLRQQRRVGQSASNRPMAGSKRPGRSFPSIA